MSGTVRRDRLFSRQRPKPPLGIRCTAKERYACRCMVTAKPRVPVVVQIDTLVVCLRHDRPIKNFIACGPISEGMIGGISLMRATRAKPLLNMLLTEASLPIGGLRKLPGAGSIPFSGSNAARRPEFFPRTPKRPDLNDCVERAKAAWKCAFFAPYDLLQSNKIPRAFAHRFNH
jgi:hypothetical protein